MMEIFQYMDFMPDTARSVNINCWEPEHYTAKHGRENECNEYKSAELVGYVDRECREKSHEEDMGGERQREGKRLVSRGGAMLNDECAT